MGKKTPREYCKTIAEEDYSTTTISVLAYISRLEIEIEEYKEKEIRGDRLLVKYSHQIAVLKAERSAAIQEVCKLTDLANDLKGRLKDLHQNNKGE